MPSQADGNDLDLGRGKFYFDRFVNGVPSGLLRFVGEADKGDVSISSTNKSRFTTTKAANTKIASVDIQQTHTLTLDLMEFAPENLALALLGTANPVTQSGNSIANEAVSASAAAGAIYKLRYRNISDVTLKVGGNALDSEDVEIEDPKLGLVRILPSAIVGAGALTADYSSETFTTDRISAGTNPSIFGRVLFVEDPTIGLAKDVEVWKVKFTSGGVLALLSDDFNKMSLTGEVLDDSANHPDAPLYQVTYRGGLPSSDPATFLSLEDQSDGHTYSVKMVDGNIEVELGNGGGAGVPFLKLADTANGLFYSVTLIDGNLTVTVSTSTDAVPSIELPDQVDGHLYSLTTVNGALTVTRIS